MDKKAILICHKCGSKEFYVYIMKEGIDPDMYECENCGKEYDNN